MARAAAGTAGLLEMVYPLEKFMERMTNSGFLSADEGENLMKMRLKQRYPLPSGLDFLPIPVVKCGGQVQKC